MRSPPTGRVRVAMTREDDSYRGLDERYQIARRLDADLFVSIHADAAPLIGAARGPPSIPFPKSPRTGRRPCSPASRTAPTGSPARRSRPMPGVNMILIDLAQRESMNVSAEFARSLPRGRSASSPSRPVWHRFAAFVVLKAPDMPSILFESGYLTNATDADISVRRRATADRRGDAEGDRGPFRAAGDGAGGCRHAVALNPVIADGVVVAIVRRNSRVV